MRWRSQMPVAIRQRIAQTAVPWLARFESHLEAEPSVGVYRFCCRPRRRNGQCAGEVAVAVGVAQMLARCGPLRRNPATAHDVTRLHLENVGKIAAERDLELEDHRVHAV